jgi:prefoldin subunit 5
MSSKTEELEEQIANMTFEDISDGRNERGIPVAKFIDDVDEFANSFTPPASAELLIGAYDNLHSKYKHFESTFVQKSARLKGKIPELEKSLSLIRNLQQRSQQEDGSSKCMVRYSLAESVFARAEVDSRDGVVNLWLGANVMLEYTYQEAIDFLSTNKANAERDLRQLTEDLGFVRDQIVTSEVNMSRIYNWDVRRKREKTGASTQAPVTR